MAIEKQNTDGECGYVGRRKSPCKLYLLYHHDLLWTICGAARWSEAKLDKIRLGFSPFLLQVLRGLKSLRRALRPSTLLTMS